MPGEPGETSLRALHLISNLDVGGAQEVVRTLMPALRSAGVEASVATLRDGPLREPLEAEGIPVAVLKGRSRSLAGDPRAILELGRIYRDLAQTIERERIDVVQTHLMRSLDFLALGLKRRGRHPSIVWTFHNARIDLRPDQLTQRRWLLAPKRVGYRTLYRRGSSVAGAIVAVSDDVARAVRESIRPAAGRLVTIPNGVDTTRFHPGVAGVPRTELGVPSGAFVVACVAKFHEQKGHRMLIDALATMPRTERPVHAVLLGSGPLRAEIEERARSRGVDDRVHLLGTRADIPNVLRAADASVLPSLWEGLPMALLEAMASGLPVVATSVSGTRQVVTDGTHGLLVEPGDASALGAAMARLVNDSALRDRLGEHGLDRVRSDFSARAQAARHRDLYLALTANRSRTS